MLSNFASKPLAGDNELGALHHHPSIGCSESEDEILNVGNVSFHCMSEEEIDMVPPPAGKYLVRSPTSSTVSCASAASTPEEEGMEQTLEETVLTIAGDGEEEEKLTRKEQEQEATEQPEDEGQQATEHPVAEEEKPDGQPRPDLVDHLRYLVDSDPFFADLILTASEVADEYNNSIAARLSPANKPHTASSTMNVPKKKNRLLSVGKKMKRLPKSLFGR